MIEAKQKVPQESSPLIENQISEETTKKTSACFTLLGSCTGCVGVLITTLGSQIQKIHPDIPSFTSLVLVVIGGLTTFFGTCCICAGCVNNKKRWLTSKNCNQKHKPSKKCLTSIIFF